MKDLEACAQLEKIQLNKFIKFLVNSLWRNSINKFEIGTNLFGISERIFEKANSEGIKLDFTGQELLETLAEKVDGKIENRKIQTKISIVINREGKIEIITL